MNNYIIYYHTHERFGYAHTEYLCFPCATKQADYMKGGETIHPVITPDDLEHRKACSCCNAKLNWIDS